MASFTAMQPLRLAVAQRRVAHLCAFSSSAFAGSASPRTVSRENISRGSQTAASDAVQDGKRGFSRDNARSNDKWSGPRRPRDPRDLNNDRRARAANNDVGTLAPLLDTLATLKAEGRKPTAAAYIALITAAADYHARRGHLPDQDPKEWTLGLEIAMAAVRDAQASDIVLGTEAIDQLLGFTLSFPEILPSLLVEMMSLGKPTETAYNVLAAHAVNDQRLESLVVIVLEMMEHNYFPRGRTLSNLILLCAEWGQLRLALDLIDKIKDKDPSSKVASESWIHILSGSADAQFLEGVQRAWSEVVSNKAFTPDEGLVLAVLAVAGRWGDTQLAIEALSILPVLRVRPKEHHMAPLLEAYCRGGQVPEAFKVVSSMRDNGINVSPSTVKSIVDVLSTAELVDQAFYTLEDMHKAGVTIDVEILNALIQASADQKDLARARATQTAAEALGVTPNLETFNIVLLAASKDGHRDLGDAVLTELEKAGFKPNATTYANLIELCLSQRTYEDAFYYLEKMKGDGFRPSERTYNLIGRKCARNDDGRWRLVADEMATLGYKKINFGEERESRARRFRDDRRQNGQKGGQRPGRSSQRDGNDSRSAPKQEQVPSE